MFDFTSPAEVSSTDIRKLTNVPDVIKLSKDKAVTNGSYYTAPTYPSL